MSTSRPHQAGEKSMLPLLRRERKEREEGARVCLPPLSPGPPAGKHTSQICAAAAKKGSDGGPHVLLKREKREREREKERERK